MLEFLQRQEILKVVIVYCLTEIIKTFILGKQTLVCLSLFIETEPKATL